MANLEGIIDGKKVIYPDLTALAYAAYEAIKRDMRQKSKEGGENIGLETEGRQGQDRQTVSERDDNPGGGDRECLRIL